MNDISLLIAGVPRGASGGAMFERRDPISGAVATRAAAATVADAGAAVDAAAAAFPAWSAKGPTERRLLLLKAAACLAAKAGEITRLMAAETGATAGWAGFNVMLAANMLREAAAMTTQVTGETIPSDKPGCIAMAVRGPAGVVLGIAPWNAPVILGVRAVALPLADAAAIVEALIDHPAVRRINFTGSTKVGRIVATLAAARLKPVLLELGGKAPLVILDDADLEEAVNAAAFGAFLNQGQICMSTERIVVDSSVADAFAARFSAKARKLPAGDPRGATPVVLGSMIGGDAADRIDDLVRDAVAKGAELLRGGTRDGTVMTATVLDRVTPAMRIYAEESFGPVVCIVRADGTDEAVRIANDTEYGLSAAVFGRDIGRAMDVAMRIESGMCHINGPTVHDDAQIGRFGGRAGVAEFTDLRWITIETKPRHYPF